jgi:hypothetical protein
MKKPQWNLVIAAIAALLNWLVGFQWDALSSGQAAAIITGINAVAALVAAWKTRPIPPSVFTYVVSSAAALLSAYGLQVNQEHVSTFSTALIAIMALILQGQVSPASRVKVVDGEVVPK